MTSEELRSKLLVASMAGVASAETLAMRAGLVSTSQDWEASDAVRRMVYAQLSSLLLSGHLSNDEVGGGYERRYAITPKGVALLTKRPNGRAFWILLLFACLAGALAAVGVPFAGPVAAGMFAMLALCSVVLVLRGPL